LWVQKFGKNADFLWVQKFKMGIFCGYKNSKWVFFVGTKIQKMGIFGQKPGFRPVLKTKVGAGKWLK
jgi:hypothetical protein